MIPSEHWKGMMMEFHMILDGMSMLMKEIAEL
jgi:hypothetical protein